MKSCPPISSTLSSVWANLVNAEPDAPISNVWGQGHVLWDHQWTRSAADCAQSACLDGRHTQHFFKLESNKTGENIADTTGIECSGAAVIHSSKSFKKLLLHLRSWHVALTRHGCQRPVPRICAFSLGPANLLVESGQMGDESLAEEEKDPTRRMQTRCF